MTTDDDYGDLESPPRPPVFVEFNAEHVAREAAGQLSPGWRVDEGHHSWLCRAQNFVVGVHWLDEGEVLDQADVPDEHILLVPDDSSVEVTSAGGEATLIKEPSVVVLPPGESRIVGRDAGFVLRVFTSRAADVVAQAGNGSMYTLPDRSVAPLPPARPPRGPVGVTVHAMSEVPDDPARPGRIFRTDSLMINWLEPQIGPHDPDRLAPHSYDHVEQASVTLSGEYVHHVRRPWTARLRDWRADEHVHVHSPSVAIIPPRNMHTTRAVGDGTHQRIDVFAPPREDFIRRGWVLNQAAYEDGDST